MLNQQEMDLLLVDLIEDEGYKSHIYKDSVGVWTIGIGRNLESVGLSRTESMYLAGNDVKHIDSSLTNMLPKYGYTFYPRLSTARKLAVLNMAFNLGIGNLLEFINFLEFMEKKKYREAASAMLDSKWAAQVGARATRLSKVIEDNLK